jgi:hypothetical protein
MRSASLTVKYDSITELVVPNPPPEINSYSIFESIFRPVNRAGYRKSRPHFLKKLLGDLVNKARRQPKILGSVQASPLSISQKNSLLCSG